MDHSALVSVGTRLPHESRRELKSLTALRGVAAMAVVLQHFSATAQQHSRVSIPSLAPHGYVAVDFFFVLSGFIMAYTYLGSFRQRGVAAYGSFLAKRVARIVPLNVAVLAAIALGGAVSIWLTGRNILFETHNPGFDFLANVLMLQGLGIGTNLNGPSWSISVEFAAYLLFPVFLAMVFDSGARLAGAVALALFGVFWLALPSPRLQMAFETAPFSLVRCFAEFTLGLAAYRLYEHRRLAAYLFSDAVTVGLSVLAAGSLLARYDLPAVLVFPFLVVAYAGNSGRAARLLQSRPLYFLGVVSFSLYLLHNPFRPVASEVLRAVSPEPVGAVPALLFALAGSLAVIPVAWLAYAAVERPGREFVRALFRVRFGRGFRSGVSP